MRVDTVTGKWYRVYVNNDKGTKLWMKAGNGSHYFNWPALLAKRTTAVSKAGNYSLDVKTGAGDNYKTIKKVEKADCIEVLAVKGDWLKIRTNTKLECNESKHPVKSGWIRWRLNHMLVLEYFLTC